MNNLQIIEEDQNTHMVGKSLLGDSKQWVRWGIELTGICLKPSYLPYLIQIPKAKPYIDQLILSANVQISYI